MTDQALVEAMLREYDFTLATCTGTLRARREEAMRAVLKLVQQSIP